MPTTWKTSIGAGSWVYVEKADDTPPNQDTHKCVYQDAHGKDQTVMKDAVWDSGPLASGATRGALVERTPAPPPGAKPKLV